MSLSRLRKAVALGDTDRCGASQPDAHVPVVALTVSLVPVERAITLVAGLPGPRAPLPVLAVARLVDAVTTGVGASCLVRAIVLHAVLARQGQTSAVVIGAARAGGGMRAHAWVEQHERIVSVDGAGGCAPLCRVQAGRLIRVPAA